MRPAASSTARGCAVSKRRSSTSTPCFAKSPCSAATNTGRLILRVETPIMIRSPFVALFEHATMNSNTTSAARQLMVTRGARLDVLGMVALSMPRARGLPGCGGGLGLEEIHCWNPTDDTIRHDHGVAGCPLAKHHSVAQDVAYAVPDLGAGVPVANLLREGLQRRGGGPLRSGLLLGSLLRLSPRRGHLLGWLRRRPVRWLRGRRRARPGLLLRLRLLRRHAPSPRRVVSHTTSTLQEGKDQHGSHRPHGRRLTWLRALSRRASSASSPALSRDKRSSPRAVRRQRPGPARPGLPRAPVPRVLHVDALPRSPKVTLPVRLSRTLV